MFFENFDRASSPGWAATSKAPPTVPATPGEDTDGDEPANNLGLHPPHAPPSITQPEIPGRALQRWAQPPSASPVRHRNVAQRRGRHLIRTAARSGWTCYIHRHHRHSSPAKHRLTSPGPQWELSNVPCPASLDSRGWLEAPWRPSRHTVPAATRSGWWGDESRWSAWVRGPRVGSPTHLPPYHRRQAGADPLPKTRVSGWPRQRAVVSRRWRGCSWCLSGMLISHSTSLSTKEEEDPQSKKTTGSTVPRDVLARPSNSHPRQPLWGHAIDAPTRFVPGTAIAMPESHPER